MQIVSHAVVVHNVVSRIIHHPKADRPRDRAGMQVATKSTATRRSNDICTSQSRKHGWPRPQCNVGGPSDGSCRLVSATEKAFVIDRQCPAPQLNEGPVLRTLSHKQYTRRQGYLCSFRVRLPLRLQSHRAHSCRICHLSGGSARRSPNWAISTAIADDRPVKNQRNKVFHSSRQPSST